jgi:hypothetical protein|tara:strand:+ start:150 stop:671 length:522 start_codon:yes stop_codon:yes gene_type:complete
MKIELKVDSVDWAPGNQNGMICCEWTVRIEAWIKDGEGNIIESIFENRTLFISTMYLQVSNQEDRELRLIDKLVSELTTIVDEEFYNKGKDIDKWGGETYKTGDLATWVWGETSKIILFVEEDISVVPVLNGKSLEDRVLGKYLFFQYDEKGRQVKNGWYEWMSDDVVLQSSS